MESWAHDVSGRFKYCPDVCLQDLSPGCTSEPQREPTIAVGIMGARNQWQILVLPRRLPPGSRLWLDFQGPASLQEAGSSGYVSVPQKNPRIKEPYVGFSGRIIVAYFVVFALFLILVCFVCGSSGSWASSRRASGSWVFGTRASGRRASGSWVFRRRAASSPATCGVCRLPRWRRPPRPDNVRILKKES